MQLGAWAVDYHTEVAGTVIVDVIPPVPYRLVAVSSFSYRVPATQHTLTFMKACGQTRAAAAAAAAQKDITLASVSLGFDSNGAAENLAAGDWLAWQDSSRGFVADVIASIVVATGVVTMTADVPVAIASGAKVWAFYEVGRACHHVFLPAASALFLVHGDYNMVIGGITPQKANCAASVRSGYGDPVLFHSNNLTNAGFLEQVSGVYQN